jgi:hexosaminidase
MTLFPRPQRASIGSRRFALTEPSSDLAPGHRPEGYRLRVGADGISIEATDEVGLFRGRATLHQLAEGREVPEAEIVDWPDFPVRGVMLDIARDKVPTMETLRQIVDVMAAWKLNHLQLYMEHTYAYADHAEVWAAASPVTPDELAELHAYAAAHHVELAANQNGLGHMERWLCKDRYRPLAIDPSVYIDDRGRPHFPSTLEPTNPAALALVRSLLNELLPNFASPLVNVGLDEPWELRAERAPDYGAYISALRASPELDGRQMLIWGDIVAQHPELVPDLPDGVTVLEWGYDAGHPFTRRGQVLAESSLPFWVCPGTSSWNSLLGRWTNARQNCLEAAEAGLATGATGYLITDWGDGGHYQPRPVSLPGLAAGAGASWNAAATTETDLAGALAEATFDGVVLGPGRAAGLLELGDAHRAVAPQSPNNVAVLLHFFWPNLRVGQRSTEGLDGEQLDAYEAALDEGLAKVDDDPAGTQTKAELGLMVAIAKLMTDDARGRLAGDGSMASIPEATRARLAGRASELESQHRGLWLGRNRPGGLDDSADRLSHLARCYRQGRGLPFVPRWVVPAAG